MLDRDTGWSISLINVNEQELWVVCDQWGSPARFYKTKRDAELFLDWICGTYVERHYLNKKGA